MAFPSPPWHVAAEAGGVGRRTGGCLRGKTGGFSKPVENGADRTAGGGYHFRRRAVFPWVVCANDGLQSGKACRVTRVGSSKPACWLILGCGRPLKGWRGIPRRIHRQCSTPGKPCPLSAHRELGA